jgi:hypothetical protein
MVDKCIVDNLLNLLRGVSSRCFRLYLSKAFFFANLGDKEPRGPEQCQRWRPPQVQRNGDPTSV